jgi:hypothetical protein
MALDVAQVIDSGAEFRRETQVSEPSCFHIGSTDKTFTALLRACLVAEGTTEIDRRLGDVLDVPDGLAGITLHAPGPSSSASSLRGSGVADICSWTPANSPCPRPSRRVLFRSW